MLFLFGILIPSCNFDFSFNWFFLSIVSAVNILSAGVVISPLVFTIFFFNSFSSQKKKKESHIRKKNMYILFKSQMDLNDCTTEQSKIFFYLRVPIIKFITFPSIKYLNVI